VVAEVQRAAQIRSRVERKPVSPDCIVERALRAYLWLDDDEMRAGGPRLPAVVPEAATPPLPPYHAFGSMVRTARLRGHVLRSQLAKVLAVPAHTVANIEAGYCRPATPEAIMKLAELLQLDVTRLLALATLQSKE
jgi:DNA-binding XRE family transcriptional regulator